MAFAACHALYFFNLRGDILLEKRYRDSVDREIAENFRTQILNNKDTSISHAPVRTLGSCTFMYLRHADVYLLCIARNNVNVMMAFQLMSSLVDLFKEYFNKDVTEASIRDNFSLMYEVLDEAVDYGYPQLTDHAIVSSLITQKGFKSDANGLDIADMALEMLQFQKKIKRTEEPAANATLQVTGAVSWRKEGIRYKRNQLFLDIIEQVNVLVSQAGSVLHAEVIGKMVLKVLLSDMPELRMGINDAAQDVTFHQCVNLGTYEANKVVTFIPPDGEFELMRYRCQDNVNLPFRVLSLIKDVGRTRLEVTVTVKSTFSSKLSATGVSLLVPVPDNTSKCVILCTAGKAKYDATKKGIMWKVGKFQGESEHTLRAEVMLMANTRAEANHPWARSPINMSFAVPMCSASGLRVAYLNVFERRVGSGYKVDKWVRKVVKSGNYQIRS